MSRRILQARLQIIYKKICFQLPWCCGLLLLKRSNAEKFTLGYLTGSQRRPGDYSYQRPGRVISGMCFTVLEKKNTESYISNTFKLAILVNI